MELIHPVQKEEAYLVVAETEAVRVGHQLPAMGSWQLLKPCVRKIVPFSGILHNLWKVFVDFFAEWCGPCKMVAPKLEELSNAHPDVIFIKVDVDQAQDLAQKFAVRAMPTFMAFYKGEKIGDCVGADLSKIGKLIEELKKTQPFAGEAKTLGGSTAAPAAGDAAAAREARAKAAEARLAAMSGAGST